MTLRSHYHLRYANINFILTQYEAKGKVGNYMNFDNLRGGVFCDDVLRKAYSRLNSGGCET